MILVSLELENYRQYRSERIEFPERGIVGVVGANGVGKTTLFEAIEWALYAPRQISREEVPPRGIPGKTTVALRLFDPRDGTMWVVERSQNKSGGKQAEIYREDNPSQPLVVGSDAATKYVATQLVGLSRDAFISTFFTRQKELSFFGALRATERRREVSRLLGLEVIRAAQALIGDERNLAEQTVRGLTARIGKVEAERDFAVERSALEAKSAELAAARDKAQVAQAATVQLRRDVRTRLVVLRKLEGVDRRIRLELSDVDGQSANARDRQLAAERQLVEIDRKERELVRLTAIAKTAPQLAETNHGHELELERFRQAEQEERRAQEAIQQLAHGAERLREFVTGLPAGGVVPGWVWQPGDTIDPAAAAERLSEVSAAADPGPAGERAQLAERCVASETKLNAATQLASRCRDLFAQLEQERADLIGNVDLETTLREQREGEAQARSIVVAAQAKLATARVDLDRYQRLMTNLRSQQFDEPCPTCGRPFSREDLELTVKAFATQAEVVSSEIATYQQEMQHGEAEVLRRQQQVAETEQWIKAIIKIDERLAVGRVKVVESAAAQATAEEEFTAALLAGGYRTVPDEAERSRLANEAELVDQVRQAGPTLQDRRDHLRGMLQIQAEAMSARDAIGTVTYDAAAHSKVTEAYRAAMSAAETAKHLAEDVSHRPEWNAAAESAAAEFAELGLERERLTAELMANGHDPDVLAVAQTEEERLDNEERELGATVQDAVVALGEAVNAVEQLRVAEAAFVSDQEQTIALRREADDLSRMYTEFDAFEKYVAGQLGPRIAETAGELIERVTAGKYTRVDLDENYGMRVFDGEEAFPIEQFSGGERDVFALAARLALSRVVGGQALNRPRFLVLDEVFGSLDQERRRQVLDVLCRLTQETEDFRQMFIISHVEDVVESELMDQIWRVTELDGASRVDVSVRNEQAALAALAGALG